MADGMCGPSNALQSFQKHSTVDRTLQQDRFIARQSPSQGFRSSQVPAGVLEPEFEAFQTGQLPLDHAFQPQHFSHAPPNFQQPGPSNWASDFQRLNISSSPPHALQRPFNQQVHQGHVSVGWHQEFARQQIQVTNPSLGQASFQHHAPMSGYISPQFAGGIAGPLAQATLTQQKQPEELFDEEAFERAFQEAQQSEVEALLDSEVDVVQDTSHQQGVEIGQDILLDESAENLMASSALNDQETIGADTIYNPKTQESEEDMNDPDALSRTAGILLHTIRHEQSEKFQNSQFMELMRQFRDGHATVQGDRVVDLDGSSQMSGGEEAFKRERELAYLTQTLKKLVLDRDRPFQRNPENIQKLLNLLLLMESKAKGVNQEVLAKLRFQRTLAAITSSPVIITMPSILAQATHTFNFNESALVYDNAHKSILDANAQIESFIPSSSTDVAREYIWSQLSTDYERRQESMSKVLGYNLPRNLSGEQLFIHEQRAKDILGSAIMHVKDVCEKRGFFCTELSVRTFFDLVEDYKRYEASRLQHDHDAFIVAVLSAEREVEGNLRGFMSAVKEGAAYEQQLVGLEYQSRLRHMQVCREGNLFPGEEGWANAQMRQQSTAVRNLEERRVAGNTGADEMRDMAEEAIERVKTGE